MLTVVKIRESKARATGYRMPDSGGLHLYVTPGGVKSWRYRYELGGKEKTAVLGRYPEMTLADARAARDALRINLRDHGTVDGPAIAPSLTFEEAAREWHAINTPRWKPHHAADVLASLAAEIFPAFGAKPVDRITPDTILAALRVMEARGAVETARRVKQRCAAVFAFAGVPDPTQSLRGRLAPLPVKGHRPALLDLAEARALIVAIDNATGHPSTKLALRFLALTAVRPGEVAGARWAEMAGLDTDAPVWRVPAERMKGKIEHIVPLAHQAVAVLDALRPLNGRSPFVFPNAWNMKRPMSENAMGYMLIRLGYQGRHVPHGWRATFSSIMNEAYPADRQAIDLMLAHVPKDRVEGAYNRAAHIARRRVLAGLWADMLMAGAADAGTVLTGPRRQS